MSYSEYGFYRRDERECRYQEYGDLSSEKQVRTAEFDAGFEKFVSTMRELKRLEDDGFAISREDREAIFRGEKSIEDFKAEHGQKEDSAEPEPAPEAPETAVQEAVQETSVENYTAEPENKSKKRSKKKRREVTE